jgi:hypothetical protein
MGAQLERHSFLRQLQRLKELPELAVGLDAAFEAGQLQQHAPVGMGELRFQIGKMAQRGIHARGAAFPILDTGLGFGHAIEGDGLHRVGEIHLAFKHAAEELERRLGTAEGRFFVPFEQILQNVLHRFAHRVESFSHISVHHDEGLGAKVPRRQDGGMHLLLGAFPPELGPFLDAPPPGWSVACTGVGQILAAASTARLIEELRPRSVLFVGTCGHFDDRLRIGDMIWGQEAISSSLEERRGESYRPVVEETRWKATLTPLDLPSHSVVVPPAITRTREGAALLAPLGAAEHLELTGVYAACHAVDVPVGAALAVVNEVGPEAQTQWKTNYQQASRDLIVRLQGMGVFG